MKLDFEAIGSELKEEYALALQDLNSAKLEMDDTISVSDWVAGFDIDFNVDDWVDFLDVY